MKKYFKILAIFIFTLILTGCVRYKTTVEVGMNKKVNLELIMAVDTEMVPSEDAGDYDLDEEEKKEFTDKGFTVNNYTDGSYKGYKISRKFKNIDTISSENDVKFSLEDDISSDDSKVQMFKVKKGFLKNTYTLKLDANNDMTTSDEMSSYLGSMELTFTLKLPKKSISNNANTVNKGGKELVWDLSKGTNVEAEFEVYNAPFYMIIGGGILLIIIVVCIIIKGKKKGGNAVAYNAVNNMADNSMNQMNPSIQNNVNPMPINNMVDNGMNQMNPNIQNDVNPMPVNNMVDNSMNQMNPSIQNDVNPMPVNNMVDNGMNQVNSNIQTDVNPMPINNMVDNGMNQMNPNIQNDVNPMPVNNMIDNSMNQMNPDIQNDFNNNINYNQPNNNNFNNPNNGTF